MCSEPFFIIIQLRVYREEIIQARNGSAHSAHCESVYPIRRPPALQSRQSFRKQTHSNCSR